MNTDDLARISLVWAGLGGVKGGYHHFVDFKVLKNIYYRYFFND